MKDFADKKIALVHDWLTGMRGGEKVLETFCEMFTRADIYTLLWNKGSVSKSIESHKIYTSFLQNMPLVENKYRYYLPVMPFAISRFNLKGYDLVISSSHCVAKGVSVPDNVPHICYCYTPMRYIWDQYTEYFNSKRSGIIVNITMSFIRKYLQSWDIRTSKSISEFVVISNFIKDRVKRIYNRDSVVIYPPVNIHGYPKETNGNYYLMVSALVPYKRVDLAIEAFNKLGYKLKIIGSGPDNKRLVNMAKSNIEFLGWLSDNEIKKYYSECKAFIFPQEEDFGITAVEAQAAGKPVIAFAKGGALETIRNNISGILFNKPDVESLCKAVVDFEAMKFDAAQIKENSKKFSHERFKKDIFDFINEKI